MGFDKSGFKGFEKSWFKIDVGLYEIYESGIYKSWGFEKFADYVSEGLRMEYRIAMKVLQVGKAIKQFGITEAQVGHISWSKFKELTLLFHEDMTKKELDDYIKKAEKMSFRELQSFVEDERVIEEGEVRHRKVKISFTLLKFQAQVVEEALTEAKVLAQTESDELALEYLCADWLMSHDPKVAARVLNNIHKEESEAASSKAMHKKHANKGKTTKKAEKTITKKKA